MNNIQNSKQLVFSSFPRSAWERRPDAPRPFIGTKAQGAPDLVMLSRLHPPRYCEERGASRLHSHAERGNEGRRPPITDHR